MCEREYVACGGCDEPVAGNVRMVSNRYYSEAFYESLDEDGDPDGLNDEHGDTEPSGESEFSHYECGACGWTGGSLDMECVPNDCDCAECVPTLDSLEPDHIIALRRDDGARLRVGFPEREGEWPEEVRVLMSNRLIHFLPITVERAHEIRVECEDELDIELGADSGAMDPLYFDPSMSIPERVVEELRVEPKQITNIDQLPIEEATVAC